MNLAILHVFRARPCNVAAVGAQLSRGLDVEVGELDEAMIARFFPTPERGPFLEWHRTGFRGLVLSGRGEWIAYGWLATPDSGPAPHLPRWAGNRFWIFNCHTRVERRGQGYYGALLVELVALAADLGCAPAGTVFIDTESDNLPGRRAIERVGFEPAARLAQLTVSRLGLRLTTPLQVSNAGLKSIPAD